jgi:hypothetical protein
VRPEIEDEPIAADGLHEAARLIVLLKNFHLEPFVEQALRDPQAREPSTQNDPFP